jgi:hypothetical protein
LILVWFEERPQPHGPARLINLLFYSTPFFLYTINNGGQDHRELFGTRGPRDGPGLGRNLRQNAATPCQPDNSSRLQVSAATNRAQKSNSNYLGNLLQAVASSSFGQFDMAALAPII